MQRLSFFLFVFGVFLTGAFLRPSAAFAASVYAVDATTATVGTSAALEIEYTVDTALQTWADADTLTVQLPANFPNWASLTYTAEYDTDTSNDATGETAIIAGGSNGDFQVIGDTITVKWSTTIWGAPINGASTIRILITAGAVPTYANATSTFTFGGSTAAADTTPSGTDTVNVSAANAAASVNVLTPVVGSTSIELAFTLPNGTNLTAGDTVTFTLPAHISAGTIVSVAQSFSTGSFSCAAVGSAVTCTISGTIFGEGVSRTLELSGFTNLYTVTGSNEITDFAANESSAGNADIVSDTTVEVTDITAADAAGSVTLGLNQTINTSGNTTVTFTLPVALDLDDTVELTFPAQMSVTSAAFSSQTFGGGGTFSCSGASQVVTCTVDAGAISAATGTIVLSGVRATFVSSLDASSLEVENEGSASQDIATESTLVMTNTKTNDDDDDSSSGGGGGASSVTYGITVTAPEEGAEFTPGEITTITWDVSGTGSISAVDLSYSTDEGATFTDIVTGTANDGTYSWTVPDVYADVIVRAEGTDLVSVVATDDSSEFFIYGTQEEDADASDDEDAVDAEDVDVSEDSEEMLPEGTYMKSESWSTVYYVEDSTRRPFLDSQTFFTYAENFDDVITVEDGYLANYTIGKPMLPSAGVVLVKIQSVAKVYAVEDIGGVQTLRWITSEEVAQDLFGDAWADYVIDVPVTAWSQFEVGDDVDVSADLDIDLDIMKTRVSIAVLL